jgi:hypothetical protein
MKLFALGPAALWLACGALAVLAATIILSPVKTPHAPAHPAAEAGP